MPKSQLVYENCSDHFGIKVGKGRIKTELLFLTWYTETRRTCGFNFAFSIENQVQIAMKVNDHDRLIHDDNSGILL